MFDQSLELLKRIRDSKLVRITYGHLKEIVCIKVLTLVRRNLPSAIELPVVLPMPNLCKANQSLKCQTLFERLKTRYKELKVDLKAGKTEGFLHKTYRIIV